MYSKPIILLFLLFLSKDLVASTESQFEGVWENEQLNFYLEFKDGIYRRFQYTNLSCFSGSAGFLPSVGIVYNNTLDNYYQLQQEADYFYISRPQDALKLALKPINKIPYACRGQPLETALSNFYMFWQTIYEIYNFSHIKKEDWNQIFQQYLPVFIDLDLRLFENKEAENLYVLERFSEMLWKIGDPHLFILAPDVQKSVYADDQRFQFSDNYENVKKRYQLAAAQAEQLSNNVSWFANNNIVISLKHNYVYINLLSLTNFDKQGLFTSQANQALEEAIAYLTSILSEKSHVVIDLRFNEGGSIEYANALSSVFSTTVQTVSLIESLNSNNSTLTPLSSLTDDGVKVASIRVLTSNYTASAAEFLTLNLKALGAVVIGEPTRGAFSPVILKTLPNGWIIGIPPFSTYFSDQQPLPEGIGIIPDVMRTWDKDDNIGVFTFEDWQKTIYRANLTPIDAEK